jgi:hypothetical protein
MSHGKIVKAGGAEPNEFELSVAQEFANLEVNLCVNKFIYESGVSKIIMFRFLPLS